MNFISQILEEKRRNSTCALVPFITAGYPNMSTTLEALYALDDQGADIIELGVPYADALADGPIIQKSSKVALDQGVNLNQVISLLDKVQYQLKAPIVIFTYYNPILVKGINNFIEEISIRGVKGLIVPDLPIEETDYLSYLCGKYSVELILFIAPTSSRDRITNILQKAPGCVYLVSSTGVTGVRHNINNQIDSLSTYIKSNTSKLIMLGFGISSPEQVLKVSSWNIDAIVVGSAFVRIMSSDIENSFIINSLVSFCKSMKSAIRSK
uniref:Tryptophan synthase alpha chain n=1 Tax=Chondria sp. (in: red algae) TaxID=1982705 RepID=A0A1Z1ME26_9FLOR|nr:Tryptophan synthase alpha subunit [Chondria sp. (in: red algae)]